MGTVSLGTATSIEGWKQPGSPRTRYLGMDRRILTRDTGAAIGLITGIILGSLLLNLTGSY